MNHFYDADPVILQFYDTDPVILHIIDTFLTKIEKLDSISVFGSEIYYGGCYFNIKYNANNFQHNLASFKLKHEIAIKVNDIVRNTFVDDDHPIVKKIQRIIKRKYEQDNEFMLSRIMEIS